MNFVNNYAFKILYGDGILSGRREVTFLEYSVNIIKKFQNNCILDVM